MKAITSEQMQKVDAGAINGYGIPGLTLMENAGRGCADAIIAHFSGKVGNSAVIVAGKGNNGGDGYVIARLLHGQGWGVTVILLAPSGEVTGDAAVNLALLPSGVRLYECAETETLAAHDDDFSRCNVIVDAIFGTGLKAGIQGVYRQAVEAINGSGTPVLSVDIPSGIHGSSGELLGVAVKADLTVTFAAAKIGHILYPGALHCGRLEVVDIGIPSELIDSSPGVRFVDHAEAAAMVKLRDRTSHKGSNGHCLIVAGSTGHTGAAHLSAASAVRAGAGLVTLAVPSSLNPILEVKTTEAMTLPLADSGRGCLDEDALTGILDAVAGKSVVALGPGISRYIGTSALVRKAVREISLPMVMDADALNAISEDITVLQERPASSMILTPHPGEMARLTGLTVQQIEADRIGIASGFAMRNRVFLILKGARTVIASPEGEIAINGSGNPGMASGGMGDVLTGVVAALLCQGYDPFDACCLGVFVHGYAADIVAEGKGEIGLTATDLVESLPHAFKRLSAHFQSHNH